MHIDTFYLYARETVIGNIAACNTRLQAYNEHVYSPKIGRKTIKKKKRGYNIGVIVIFRHF